MNRNRKFNDEGAKLPLDVAEPVPSISKESYPESASGTRGNRCFFPAMARKARLI
ncbi:MAG: hypothetical protein ABID54_09205 [Pseudomonadota bacterium]